MLFIGTQFSNLYIHIADSDVARGAGLPHTHTRSRRSRIGIKFIDPATRTYGVELSGTLSSYGASAVLLPEMPGFHCVSLLPEVPGFHWYSPRRLIF